MNSINKNKIFYISGAVASVCIPILLFINNIFAEWWLIDDHELFSFLGTIKNHYSFADFISILLEKTEVGRFAETSRFRPSYFILRLVELYLYGLNPTIFYVARLIVSILFSVALYLFLYRFLSVFVSLALVLVVWSYPFWSDVFSRMGPAEIYGSLGLAFLLFSYSVPGLKIVISSFLRVVGLLILVGAKENFIIFVLVSFYELTQLFYYRERKVYFYFFEVLPILYTFYIALSLYGFYSTNSEDIYGNSTSILDRLNLYSGLLREPNFFVLSFILIVLSTFVVTAKGFLRSYRKIIFLIFFCSALYVFNFVFYHAKWPTGMRYDFPAVFLVPIMVVLFLNVFLNHYHFSHKKQILVLLFVSLYWLDLSGLKLNLKSSLENRRRTVVFSTFLNGAVTSFKENPDKDIVIRIASAWDYEPYFSLMVFFKYYDLKNRIFLRIDSIPNKTVFESQLLDVLSKLENLNVQPKNNCLVFSFVDLKSRSFCKSQEDRIVPW
ncbi:hypothetical protein ACO2KH_02510 [Leptospira terpstrae]|uniref:hypothetical protein n=1 Tax=Leptospira terpstrae TaxID=293075 RepID=UPI003CFE218F